MMPQASQLRRDRPLGTGTPGKGGKTMTVRLPRYSKEEHARRGTEIYERDIRPQVEAGNRGKVVAIDIETGDYEVGEDLISTGDRMFARHPGAALYGARIGYNAVYAVGGSLVRTS